MSTINFKEIIDACQAEALANKLSPSEDSVYRSLTRRYSKRFNVSLATVRLMSIHDILLDLYEDQLEDIDTDDHLEDFKESIRKIKDPNYEENEEAAMDDFEEQALREEEERIKAGKPVHHSLRKQASLEKRVSEVPEAKSEKNPTGGFIDLSYLEKEDQS